MDVQLLSALGIIVTVALFIIGYSKTEGAKKEREPHPKTGPATPANPL